MLPHPELMQFSLPLIGRVAAGSPILAEEHISANYQVDPSLFSAKPDYLLKVRGMSMRDAGILDGDLLAVKKADSAKDGQIVVARLDDEVLTGAQIEAVISGRNEVDCDEAAGATRIKRLRDTLGNQLVAELLVKTVARRGYMLAVGKDVIKMI
jgi:phage repressor protein C with HTH and peptisase S24 domain